MIRSERPLGAEERRRLELDVFGFSSSENAELWEAGRRSKRRRAAAEFESAAASAVVAAPSSDAEDGEGLEEGFDGGVKSEAGSVCRGSDGEVDREGRPSAEKVTGRSRPRLGGFGRRVWADPADADLDAAPPVLVRGPDGISATLPVPLYEEHLRARAAQTAAGRRAERWVEALRGKRDAAPSAGERFIASANPAVEAAAANHFLHYRPLGHLNAAEPSRCVVSNVGFLPTAGAARLLYTAGADKSVRIFDVTNSNAARKVSSTFFAGAPIRSAAVGGAGGPAAGGAAGGGAAGASSPPRLYLVGDRRTLAYFDVASEKTVFPRSRGRAADKLQDFNTVFTPPPGAHAGELYGILGDNGNIAIFDARTAAPTHTFHMNAPHCAFAIHGARDGKTLERQPVIDRVSDLGPRVAAFALDDAVFSGDCEGCVYRWSLRAGRCMQTFSDHGSLCVTSLAAHGTLLAVGSESGFVNVYAGAGGGGGAPAPARSLKNLRTACTSLEYSLDGRLLAFASSKLPDSVRLASVAGAASVKVYPNFPYAKKAAGGGGGGGPRVSEVNSVAFDDSATCLAVGNQVGAILGYELHNA